jgi:hypothetical protein
MGKIVFSFHPSMKKPLALRHHSCPEQKVKLPNWKEKTT